MYKKFYSQCPVYNLELERLRFVNESKNINSCETNMKIEIKEEDLLSNDITSQNKSESFNKYAITKTNSSAMLLDHDCDMTIKTDIKSEIPFSCFGSQEMRKCCTKHLIEHIKSETVTSSNNCETEIAKQTLVSDLESHNEREFPPEDSVMMVEKQNCDHEMHNRINIKEEPWLGERDITSVCDDIKNVDSPLVKSSSLYRYEASRDKSDKNFGNNVRFNMAKESPEYEIARNYTTKEIDLSETSSVQKNIYSEQHEDGQLLSKSSCLEYNFVQQNSVEVHDFNRKNDYGGSVLIRDNIDEKFKCEICDKKFTLAPDLKRHKLIHKSKRPHKCDICEKNFVHLSHLKNHKLIHEGIRPNKCDICGKCFTLMENLKRHKLTHKGIKPHKCDTCGNSYTQLADLKRHKLVHEGIKPHKCDICGKCFTGLTELKRHKLTHEGIKPYKCDICGKLFIWVTNLKRHKFTHGGIKPYKCDICGNSFTQSSNFKKHKLTHDGIKPHKCDICDKSFVHLSHFKQHNLTHEGIKPHKCDICEKCFAGLTDLRRHKLTHEGIKPFKCDTCGKCFSRLHSLKNHKFTHQGIKPHV